MARLVRHPARSVLDRDRDPPIGRSVHAVGGATASSRHVESRLAAARYSLKWATTRSVIAKSTPAPGVAGGPDRPGGDDRRQRVGRDEVGPGDVDLGALALLVAGEVAERARGLEVVGVGAVVGVRAVLPEARRAHREEVWVGDRGDRCRHAERRGPLGPEVLDDDVSLGEQRVEPLAVGIDVEGRAALRVVHQGEVRRPLRARPPRRCRGRGGGTCRAAAGPRAW